MSNKINDTAWTVEEQYFNSTLSLADKGKVHKDMMEIWDLEMVYRNVSPRLQHLVGVQCPFMGCLGLCTGDGSQC